MPRFLASRRAMAWAALVLLALMLVSVNLIAGRFLDLRLDLTQERLYTLSPGTLRTLANIDEPITVRFYYSAALGNAAPSYGVYAQRVRALLAQYVAAAHGKLRLEVYDPQPFSTVEDQAVAFGLQGAPLNAGGEAVYFGLAATNSTDDQQVIRFFSPARERFLEYDLTKIIHSLAFPKKTVVGLMTTLPLQGNIAALMEGLPSRPEAAIEQLRQLDRVETVATDVKAIPKDVDVLMIVQPQNLPSQTLYAIDQFVLGGGKALVFVDPYSEMQMAARGRRGIGMDASSDLPPLFKAWGIRLAPGLVAGDRRDARQVGVPAPGGRRQVLDYIAWLDLGKANLNRTDPITASLNSLSLASAGILEREKDAKTTVEPLIETSSDSARIPVAKVMMLPDVAGLLADFKPDGKRYMLAARVSGIVDTAFPGGPPGAAPKPAAPAATKPTAAQLKRATRPINVVVVADSDILDDRFWVREQQILGQRIVVPTANNGDFVANAVEVLAGGEDLIGLRSRGTSARPFTVVERLRHEAEARYSAEQRALQQKLGDTQAQLQNLTGRDTAKAPAALSPEQAKAVAQFRAELLQTRRQLRGVEAALRGSIERLRARIEFLDIALIPILVAIAALVIGALRLRRRRRHAAEA
jgi:ABC-type uncharacterized transport system involved in gliding motility auxiliary subunit